MCHKVYFKAEFNIFELSVVLFRERLPYQGYIVQCALLFTHGIKEISWIHTFPKDISTNIRYK